jgi:hypothetical protein
MDTLKRDQLQADAPGDSQARDKKGIKPTTKF